MLDINKAIQKVINDYIIDINCTYVRYKPVTTIDTKVNKSRINCTYVRYKLKLS